MKLWNPVAFTISLMMSILMAIIFGMMIPSYMGLPGLERDLCLYLWPIRCVVAYLLIITLVYPMSLSISRKIFSSNPDDVGLWNPPAFFITLIMTLIMAAIFGLPFGLPIDQLFYFWPLRWITAYLLIVIIVYPISSWHAEKIFGFARK